MPPPKTGTQGREALSTSAAAAQQAATDEGRPLASHRRHVGRQNTPKPGGLGVHAAAQAASLLHNSGKEKLHRAHATSEQAPYTPLQQAGTETSWLVCGQAGRNAQNPAHAEQTHTRTAGQHHHRQQAPPAGRRQEQGLPGPALAQAQARVAGSAGPEAGAGTGASRERRNCRCPPCTAQSTPRCAQRPWNSSMSSAGSRPLNHSL